MVEGSFFSKIASFFATVKELAIVPIFIVVNIAIQPLDVPAGEDGWKIDNFIEVMEARYVKTAGDWRRYICIDRPSNTLRIKFDDEVLEVHLSDRSSVEASFGRRYWRTRDEVLQANSKNYGVLGGLHLAIDPGHIGGEWAHLEHRQFQLGEDIPVKEGDLNLIVARMVRERLEDLGGRVTLIRPGPFPVLERLPEDGPERALFDNQVAEVLPGELRNAPTSDPLRAAAHVRAANRLRYVVHDIQARADLVNRKIKPDAVVAIHFNADPWPENTHTQLSEGNHFHVIVFGGVMESEWIQSQQRYDTLVKVINQSGTEESKLGGAIAESFLELNPLPPFIYKGRNAVAAGDPKKYVWARNLMANRLFHCPTVYLEPYVMNGEQAYARIQKSLEKLEEGQPPPPGCIFLEYTEAVVGGILRHYTAQN